MTICLADLYRPVSPKTRRVLQKLAQQGVISVSGCVIASAAAMGEPPAGHDHVLTRTETGTRHLEKAEHMLVQSVMADEMKASISETMADEGDMGYVVETNYVMRPTAGTVSLEVLVHGLIDHVVRVSLS